MNAQIREILPIAVPLAIIILAIVTAALLDLRKQAATRGPKWMWAIIICLTSFIGPLAYFTMGRKEE